MSGKNENVKMDVGTKKDKLRNGYIRRNVGVALIRENMRESRLRWYVCVQMHHAYELVRWW